MICEISMDERQSEHLSEFEYLEYVLDESGTDGGECYKKLAIFATVFRYFMNAQLGSARTLPSCLFVLV